MKSGSKFPPKPARNALALPKLDNDPVIRDAIVTRITEAAKTAPVVLLHQIATVLEGWEP